MDEISNAELIELTLSAAEHIDTQFEYWLTITFALLAASFVAKTQLNAKVRIVLAVLYSATTFLVLIRYGAAGANATTLTSAILERGIQWAPEATPLLAVIRVVVILFGTSAALWFLYSTHEKTTHND